MAAGKTTPWYVGTPFEAGRTVKVKVFVCAECGRPVEPGASERPCPSCGCTRFVFDERDTALPKCA